MEKIESFGNEYIAWIGLREIFRLLGTNDGNRIIQTLLKEKDIRSSELQIKSGIAASKFHVIMKVLVAY
jgi:hypothetical protein